MSNIREYVGCKSIEAVNYDGKGNTLCNMWGRRRRDRALSGLHEITRKGMEVYPFHGRGIQRRKRDR